MSKKALLVIVSFIGFCLIFLGLNSAMVPIKVSADIPADLNGNGVVDEPDYIICGDVFDSFHNNQKWDKKADLNKDEKINALDFNVIGRGFGDTNIEWISLLTLLNRIFQEHPFIGATIGVYVAIVLFLLKGEKSGDVLIVVKHHIFRLLRRYIHIW